MTEVHKYVYYQEKRNQTARSECICCKRSERKGAITQDAEPTRNHIELCEKSCGLCFATLTAGENYPTNFVIVCCARSRGAYINWTNAQQRQQ